MLKIGEFAKEADGPDFEFYGQEFDIDTGEGMAIYMPAKQGTEQSEKARLRACICRQRFAASNPVCPTGCLRQPVTRAALQHELDRMRHVNQVPGRHVYRVHVGTRPQNRANDACWLAFIAQSR